MPVLLYHCPEQNSGPTSVERQRRMARPVGELKGGQDSGGGSYRAGMKERGEDRGMRNAVRGEEALCNGTGKE